MSVNINDSTFDEIVRRIPEHERKFIEIRLNEVNDSHLASLHASIANQKALLADSSFIHDEFFPFAVLLAVRRGEISHLQFGTLMTLWGSLDTILPKHTKKKEHTIPEFVPLFTADEKNNPHASRLLMLCLSPSSVLHNLVIKTPDELLKGIYDKAITLPKSEQGFWVVRKNKPHIPGMSQTITQTIKQEVGVNFLAFDANENREMLPSFGLRQVFLDVAFPHAVRLNPVIGCSKPLDIRAGSLNRYRDIGLPFPGNKLPKFADGFSAPSALDFIYHDYYHAIRASRITPWETAYYIAIGDHLNILQKRYNSVVKELDKRHTEHKRLLPEFGKAIENLTPNKQLEITELLLKKFNQEKFIINKLKKIRKSYGQLKFRLWDMERYFSGSLLDGPNENGLQELTRIIANIEAEISIMAMLPNMIGLSNYSGRRVANAVLETVKPEAATLTEMQNFHRQRVSKLSPSERNNLRLMQPAGLLAFDDTIFDAPTYQISSNLYSLLEFPIHHPVLLSAGVGLLLAATVVALITTFGAAAFIGATMGLSATTVALTTSVTVFSITSSLTFFATKNTPTTDKEASSTYNLNL